MPIESIDVSKLVAAIEDVGGDKKHQLAEKLTDRKFLTRVMVEMEAPAAASNGAPSVDAGPKPVRTPLEEAKSIFGVKMVSFQKVEQIFNQKPSPALNAWLTVPWTVEVLRAAKSKGAILIPTLGVSLVEMVVATNRGRLRKEGFLRLENIRLVPGWQLLCPCGSPSELMFESFQKQQKSLAERQLKMPTILEALYVAILLAPDDLLWERPIRCDCLNKRGQVAIVGHRMPIDLEWETPKITKRSQVIEWWRPQFESGEEIAPPAAAAK